jgi:hypothetical protein
MRADPTSKLIWILLWAVLIVVYLLGNYSMKLERDNERLHAEVTKSMMPPEVVIHRQAQSLNPSNE